MTCFSPDDRYLAIFGWHKSGSCRVEIWDLASRSLVLPAVQSSAEWHCRSVPFSSDSRRAAWIGNDQLIVFDIATRRVLKSRPLNYAPAFVRFCPSGCHVAIGWGDAVAVFRWQEDGDMMTLGHAGFVQDATFSSDGRFRRAAEKDLPEPNALASGHCGSARDANTRG